MSNSTTATVENYIASFNATDPAERRALVEQTFTPDARYLDPVMSGAGHDGLDAMIAGAQGQFAGCTFRLTDGPDAHNDVVRFTWQLLGPDGEAVLATGHDFGTLAGDGRLAEVTGFLAQH